MVEVVVDTDCGVDDALALLTLLRDPGVTVAGITSAAGNCSALQAARNASAVLSLAGESQVPVSVGIEPAGKDYGNSPHGRDGLGDAGRAVATGDFGTVPAWRLLRDLASPDRDLLCLAPLTNVAAAITHDPGVLSRYRRVVIMGGMGARSRTEEVLRDYPQFLTKGDTNTNHDPAAAAAVAGASGNVVWVGMNVTARLHVPFTLFDAAAGPVGEFVRDISARYARYATRTYESRELIVTAHDSVAAVVVAEPEALTLHDEGTGEVVTGEDGRASLWATAAGPHWFAAGIDHEVVLRRIRAALGVAA